LDIAVAMPFHNDGPCHHSPLAPLLSVPPTVSLVLYYHCNNNNNNKNDDSLSHPSAIRPKRCDCFRKGENLHATAVAFASNSVVSVAERALV
jgi:hypothetical protein